MSVLCHGEALWDTNKQRNILAWCPTVSRTKQHIIFGYKCCVVHHPFVLHDWPRRTLNSEITQQHINNSNIGWFCFVTSTPLEYFTIRYCYLNLRKRHQRFLRCTSQTTHTASFQQQLTFAETIGAIGELHQRFLCLMSDGGVSSLVQLLTQDLQLGKALDKQRGGGHEAYQQPTGAAAAGRKETASPRRGQNHIVSLTKFVKKLGLKKKTKNNKSFILFIFSPTGFSNLDHWPRQSNRFIHRMI